MISTTITALAPYALKKPLSNIGSRLTTTQRYPLLYRPITKCGCTFLKNVLNHLDGIHDGKQNQVSANSMTNEDVMNAKVKFIVIRNPIDRFTSLYFDKVIGSENPIRNRMIKRNIISEKRDVDLITHQKNCFRLIKHIKRTMEPDNNLQLNWHWRRQSFRVKQVLPFNFHLLTLEGLLWQLPALFADVLPELATALFDVPLANVSKKTIDQKDLITSKLEAEILSTYALDFQIYDEVSAYWDRKKQRIGSNGKT